MVTRRNFLKGAAATAAAIAVAPLIPLAPPRVEWFDGPSVIYKPGSVVKISTVIPMTQEMLEDAPEVRSYVESRLRRYIEFSHELELAHA